MNYKPFFLLLFFLKSLPSHALGTDTVKLFYPIGKYQLAADAKMKLQSLANSLSAADTIRVFGYADYLGNTKGNALLSANRAAAIKDYMLSINKNLLIITEGRGELPATTARSIEGEPINRRVDVVIAARAPVKKAIAEQPKIEPPELTNIQPEIKSNPVEIKRPDSLVHKMPDIEVREIAPADERSFNQRMNDLGKLNVGSSVSFEELTFQPGRHFLNPEAVRYVNILLKYLTKHKNIVFEIQGHICCDQDNKDGIDFDTGDYTLSTNRAKFIYDYFLSKGISADRMTYKGFAGSKHKVWPERTEHDRYLNRRVELLIVGR